MKRLEEQVSRNNSSISAWNPAWELPARVREERPQGYPEGSRPACGAGGVGLLLSRRLVAGHPEGCELAGNHRCRRSGVRLSLQAGARPGLGHVPWVQWVLGVCTCISPLACLLLSGSSFFSQCVRHRTPLSVMSPSLAVATWSQSCRGRACGAGPGLHVPGAQRP